MKWNPLGLQDSFERRKYSLRNVVSLHLTCISNLWMNEPFKHCYISLKKCDLSFQSMFCHQKRQKLVEDKTSSKLILYTCFKHSQTIYNIFCRIGRIGVLNYWIVGNADYTVQAWAEIFFLSRSAAFLYSILMFLIGTLHVKRPAAYWAGMWPI